jgi:hypothetical protein
VDRAGRAGRSRPPSVQRRWPHPVAHERDPAADAARRRVHGRDGVPVEVFAAAGGTT